MISLNDLNYDFSNDYFDIDRRFAVDEDNIFIFFIPMYDEDFKLYALKCVFEDELNDSENEFISYKFNHYNIIEKCKFISFKNNISKRIKKDKIEDLLSDLVRKTNQMYITNLAIDLVEDITNIFEYLPDFKSDKFPTDLDEEELREFFIKKFKLDLFDRMEELDITLDLENSELMNIFLESSPKEFLESFSSIDVEKELPDEELKIYKYLLEPMCKMESQPFFDEESRNEVIKFFKSLSPLDFIQLISLVWVKDWNNLKELKPIIKNLEEESTKLYMETIFKEYEFEEELDSFKGYGSEEELDSFKDQIFNILMEDDSKKAYNTAYFIRNISNLYIDFLEHINRGLDIDKFLNDFGDTVIYKNMFTMDDVSNSKELSIEDMFILQGLNQKNIIEVNNTLLKSSTTVKMMKEVMKKYDLKIKGNKADLIKIIQDNLTPKQINEEFPGKMYVLSEECINDLVENQNMIKYRYLLPSPFDIRKFSEICSLNPEYSPDEIICCLAKEDWIITEECILSDLGHKILKEEKLDRIHNIMDILLKDNPKLLKELLKEDFSDDYLYCSEDKNYEKHEKELLEQLG